MANKTSETLKTIELPSLIWSMAGKSQPVMLYCQVFDAAPEGSKLKPEATDMAVRVPIPGGHKGAAAAYAYEGATIDAEAPALASGKPSGSYRVRFKAIEGFMACEIEAKDGAPKFGYLDSTTPEADPYLALLEDLGACFADHLNSKVGWTQKPAGAPSVA